MPLGEGSFRNRWKKPNEPAPTESPPHFKAPQLHAAHMRSDQSESFLNTTALSIAVPCEVNIQFCMLHKYSIIYLAV